MSSEISGVSDGVDATISLGEILPEVILLNEEFFAPRIESPSLVISPEEQLKIILTEGGRKQDVINVLKALFGKDLLERVVQSCSCNKWPEQLEKKDCLILLGTIGQSVTLDDIEQIFAELNAGDTTRAILKHAQLSYLRMWWAGTAKQLPTYWFNHLLDLFRNPMQMIDPQYETHLGAEIHAASLKKTPSLAFTYYDYAIKELVKQGDRSRPEFFMSPREALAKIFAYAAPNITKPGMVVPLYNEGTGELDYYQLSDQMHYKGLHAYFLTPFESDRDLPAQLIFRGSHDAPSIHRDFDPTGVGKQVFDECASKIQDMVASYAKRVENAKIEIIGHSLGASDAQRAIINLIDPTNKQQYNDIKLFAYCSPRLDQITIDRWFEKLKTLEAKEKKPQIQLNFAHHERDIVTWTGDANLSGNDDFFIPSNYLVVKSDSGLATPQHHTSSFFKFGKFNFDIDNRTFQFYKSFSEEELKRCIEKLAELEKTSGWYKTIMSYFIHVDTPEELQARIDELRAEQERRKDLNQDSSYGFIWSALTYTFQPFLYYAYGWFAGIKDEPAEDSTTLAISNP